MAIRFLWNNLADSAAVTASSSAADHPVSNIGIRWPGRTWRSTGVAAEWVKFNLGSAQNIKALIIFNHNFQLGATVKIQANSSDDWAAPPIDVTLTVTAEKITYYWAASQAYQWWRISIADAGNPDGYVEIGRVFLGGYFEPTRNHDNNWSMPWIDPSVISASTGDQASADVKPGHYEFSFNFPSIKYPDNETFDIIGKTLGKYKPFFITRDPSNLLTTYYVRSMVDWDVQHIYNNINFRLSLRLREEI
jgi:hypothetical protein